MEILPLLFTLLIIGLIVWFAFWMVDLAGIPAPMNWMLKAIVLVICLFWLFGGTVELPRVR